MAIKKVSLRSFLFDLNYDLDTRLHDGTSNESTLKMLKRRLKRLEDDQAKNYIKLID